MGNCCSPAPETPASKPAPRRRSTDEFIDGLIASANAPSMPTAPTPAESGAAAVFNDPELVATERTVDFSFKGKEAFAKIVDIYDGDTVRVKFRWRGMLIQYKARMAGYDSPEMKPPKAQPNREKEIAAAHAARDALAALIKQENPHSIVYIECGAFDKYGRLLVTAFTARHDGTGLVRGAININQWMMANGHGVAYDGGTKTPYGETPVVAAK